MVKDSKIQEQHRRIIVNVWCRSTHGAAVSLKQPKVTLNQKPLDDPTAVPTYLVATEKLIAKIESEHAGCLAAAEQAKQSSSKALGSGSTAHAGTSAAGTDVLQAMMRLAEARKRASEANVLALAAEKARDAAELEVAELERTVDPKMAKFNADVALQKARL